ncbi:hypothetical protein K438DRAFT_1772215 [Mycena galopus ATCC 62051]|nr:hypothetical protein K438DRAFT_1772215 [Mycena galopus ATCC 62051]
MKKKTAALVYERYDGQDLNKALPFSKRTWDTPGARPSADAAIRHHTLDNLVNQRGFHIAARFVSAQTCRVCGARMCFQIQTRRSCASGLKTGITSERLPETILRDSDSNGLSEGCSSLSSWQRLSFREVEAVVCPKRQLQTATRQMCKAAKTHGVFYFGVTLLAQYFEDGEVSGESRKLRLLWLRNTSLQPQDGPGGGITL